jgi:hypothetical protein
LDDAAQAADAYTALQKAAEQAQASDSDYLLYDRVQGLTPQSTDLLRGGIAEAFIKTGDIAKAAEWFDDYNACLRYIIDNGLYENIASLYKHQAMPEVIELFTKDADVKLAAAKALAGIEDKGGDDYLRLQRLRLASFFGDEDTQQQLGYFLQAGKGFSPLFDDVIMAALRCGTSFASFAAFISPSDAGAYADRLAQANEDLPMVFMSFLQSYLTAGEAEASPAYHDFIKELSLRLFKRYDRAGEDYRAPLLQAYALCACVCMKAQYSDDIFTDENIVQLSGEYQFAYHMNHALTHQAQDETEAVVQRLQMAAACHPPVKSAVEGLISDNTLAEADVYSDPSLDHAARAVKDSVLGLIGNRLFDKAEDLLNQYIQLYPQDTEINTIIRAMKKAGYRFKDRRKRF